MKKRWWKWRKCVDNNCLPSWPRLHISPWRGRKHRQPGYRWQWLGGRIAVHVTIKDEYRGGFYALGGVSPGSQHGGSGTVYVEEVQEDHFFRRLYIDNQNANPPKVFLLDEMNPKTLKANATEENGAEFGFNELMLQGDAVFRIADLGLNKRPSISVQTVLGDGSSVLHITKNQTFFIEYQEFTRRRSFPPVNFKVDYTGEVMLVSDFHVAGRRTLHSSLKGGLLEYPTLVSQRDASYWLAKISVALCCGTKSTLRRR
ncbi:hypothetical protein OS493_002935 [Desmophyllum pertusum]|uniref:Uncharacterized protein n=1 Tax=Desmophyllum pertusum TaxID=174260 RepID=A0A9W9YG95_9CNID|nr:hypothetical protein OS493_002935 [Desmophyllum pertusum]